MEEEKQNPVSAASKAFQPPEQQAQDKEYVAHEQDIFTVHLPMNRYTELLACEKSLAFLLQTIPHLLQQPNTTSLSRERLETQKLAIETEIANAGLPFEIAAIKENIRALKRSKELEKRLSEHTPAYIG